MKIKSLGRKALPAAAVFSLTFVGVLALVPRDKSGSENLVPVVVATRSLSDGTSSADVRKLAAVRMVPESARATGALASVAAMPDGVLAYDHVVGQQLLASSFAESHVRSLGKGFVAVSVKLDPQRWVGPWLEAGRIVDVYDTGDSALADPQLVAERAVILEVPDPADLKPNDDAIVSLGVPRASLTAVLLAAANNRVWLVGR